MSCSTWLGVTVLDENDWWPEWERLAYHGSVLQTAGRGAPVMINHAQDNLSQLAVTAQDLDQGYNGRVTYSLVERDIIKYFSINRHTGKKDYFLNNVHRVKFYYAACGAGIAVLGL